MIKSILFSWRPGGQIVVERGNLDFVPDLVLYFSDKKILIDIDVYSVIKEMFPDNTPIIGCSTSKPILMDDLFEGFMTGIALKFEKTPIRFAETKCLKHEDSEEAGKYLAQALNSDDLRHVLVISDGMHVNGTSLVNGLSADLNENVSISGGMSCDGFDFKTTLTGFNKKPVEFEIVAIGFYGDNIKIGCAAQGGWDPFGIDRVVTRSQGNILYEIDGESALDMYKEYMGEEAKGFPSSALMFPLSIRKEQNSDERIIRTFDKVNESDGSLRFSGDIPQGSIVQFMKGNFAHLIEGAAQAAKNASKNISLNKNTVAVAISCLGRQVAMGQRVSDELEAVVKALGQDVSLTGFYSHGEFCPLGNQRAILHNQTMTITVLSED